jgi:hypothetical protein
MYPVKRKQRVACVLLLCAVVAVCCCCCVRLFCACVHFPSRNCNAGRGAPSGNRRQHRDGIGSYLAANIAMQAAISSTAVV